jgi:hypothetical protein
MAGFRLVKPAREAAIDSAVLIAALVTAAALIPAVAQLTASPVTE